MRRIHLLWALLAADAASAEANGNARLWVGWGVDSNAQRNFVAPNDPSSDVQAEGDVVFSAIGSVDGLLEGERSQLAGAYDVGLRKFMRLPSEDVLIQTAAVESSVALGRFFGIGVGGRAKDRRGADRDYSDLIGEAFIDFVPDGKLDVRLRGAAHRFLYWNRFEYSFGTPELGLIARYRFDRRHSVTVFGTAGFRRYMGQTNPHPEDLAPEESTQRRDFVVVAGAGYAFRGPFSLSLSYAYTEQQSNSWGESTLRHTLTATAGFRLPARFTLLGQLVLQPTHYFGVHLSPEVYLLEDDETQNSLSLKLARPLSQHIDAELKLSWYHSELPENGQVYDRKLAWVGLTWRL